MTDKSREVVERAVREIIGGTQATARPVRDAETSLRDHAVYVAARIEQPLLTSAVLAHALIDAYQLGRQHALERVAIGLSEQETPGLFRGRN